MEYDQHNQDFKNLLNQTLSTMRANEPNDIQFWVKGILNASNIKFEVESIGKGFTSNYSKTADKIIEFLLHSKFIESYGSDKYVFTDPKGIKLKKTGTFELFYENEAKQNEKQKDDLMQAEIIKQLDKKVKEQQLQINAMELNYKPWAFRVAVVALILSMVTLLNSMGIITWLYNMYRSSVK